ncbi:hypothetical protein [Kitasatospora sp. HPMI-4]|uniref:hypothetical protein n=1 Tax=Kitasatospora sp. HPMI-4 TaxID=3448443 RepID=UPI003F1C088C
MAETLICTGCKARTAVLEGLDVEPSAPWCIDCALVLVKLGDPILNYRTVNDDSMYTRALARGTTATLPFG